MYSCRGMPYLIPPRNPPSHCTFSYAKRFLTIGSLLRRLHIFTDDLRRRYATNEDNEGLELSLWFLALGQNINRSTALLTHCQRV
jgi:hypothetical protein